MGKSAPARYGIRVRLARVHNDLQAGDGAYDNNDLAAVDNGAGSTTRKTTVKPPEGALTFINPPKGGSNQTARDNFAIIEQYGLINKEEAHRSIAITRDSPTTVMEPLRWTVS